MNKRNYSSKSKSHNHSHSHITSSHKSDINNSNVKINNNDNNDNKSNMISKKRPIGVAILDTGIYRHIDFENRIIAFVDFVNGQMMPYDDNGHGSQVRCRYTYYNKNYI